MFVTVQALQMMIQLKMRPTAQVGHPSCLKPDLTHILSFSLQTLKDPPALPWEVLKLFLPTSHQKRNINAICHSTNHSTSQTSAGAPVHNTHTTNRDGPPHLNDLLCMTCNSYCWLRRHSWISCICLWKAKANQVLLLDLLPNRLLALSLDLAFAAHSPNINPAIKEILKDNVGKAQLGGTEHHQDPTDTGTNWVWRRPNGSAHSTAHLLDPYLISLSFTIHLMVRRNTECPG